MSRRGVFHGHGGVREEVRLLASQLPGGRWSYHTVRAEGEMGFVAWNGTADRGARVEDGAHSFLIRDGRIRAMTVHYAVTDPEQR